MSSAPSHSHDDLGPMQCGHLPDGLGETKRKHYGYDPATTIYVQSESTTATVYEATTTAPNDAKSVYGSTTCTTNAAATISSTMESYVVPSESGIESFGEYESKQSYSENEESKQ